MVIIDCERRAKLDVFIHLTPETQVESFPGDRGCYCEVFAGVSGKFYLKHLIKDNLNKPPSQCHLRIEIASIQFTEEFNAKAKILCNILQNPNRHPS